MGRPTKKGKKEESSSQEEEQQQPIDVDEEDQEDIDLQGNSSANERRMQQSLMEEIAHQANESEGGEKLTWSAIYSLKAKQLALAKEMREQIEKIKNKYQLLKQPIYHQLSDAVLGEKLGDELYKIQGIESTVDVKKVKPTKIDNFWGIVLDKEGLLTEEVDVDNITKVSKLRVEMVDPAINHIRVTFDFTSQTDYFTNRHLQVEAKINSENGEPLRILKEEINYKKEKIAHSLFTLLFDSTTDLNEFYNVTSELYQDYSNALYYYFREQDEEDENGAIVEEDEDDDDEDEVEDVKPTKKVKQDKPIEKPECKNQ